ncbi:aminotransferase class IV [Candidatus Woesearchaeota archaeon]|nr:aminotransferase class IV [Candidatus Woesearchaeota archaeon]
MKISINGRLYEEEDAKISVLDHGLLLGDGVFETLRTFGGKIFKLDEHYERLKESARQIMLPVPVGKDALRKDIERVIKENGLKEARARVTITRGIGAAGLSIDCERQSVIITAGELKEKSFDKGVKTITYELERNLPSVKSLSYLPSVVAKAEAAKKGAFEAILIDRKGLVKEGSFSNVFIFKGGEIFTPGEGILKGITRDIAIGIAGKNGLEVNEKDITKEDLLESDEIFITFTTGGIVPVTMADDACKKVGESTKRLIRLYKEHVRGLSD